MANQTLQCTIHNIRWETPPKQHVECPMCINQKMTKILLTLKEVTEQRDLLLKAIEIKTTSVLAESLR